MRHAAVAGQFYSSRPDALRKQIEACFLSPIGPGSLPEKGNAERSVVGAVVPHAGLQYSGPVAAHVYSALAKERAPRTFIIIGPNHRGMGAGVAVATDDFQTPMGVLRLDREMAAKISGVAEPDREAHAYEHSIEVQMPFIQYLFPEAMAVPVAMGFQDYETAKELAKEMVKAAKGKDVVILASSDMSHYIPAAKAKSLDRKVIDKVLALDAKGVEEVIRLHDISACGYGPIMTMLMSCGGTSAELLRYATSGDVTPMDEVVGYAGIVVRKP
jgi:AmmeMemoRadiSam system protein B